MVRVLRWDRRTAPPSKESREASVMYLRDLLFFGAGAVLGALMVLCEWANAAERREG